MKNNRIETSLICLHCAKDIDSLHKNFRICTDCYDTSLEKQLISHRIYRIGTHFKKEARKIAKRNA